MYKEHRSSTFTHNGKEYRLNKVLKRTEKRDSFYVPTSKLDWVLAQDKSWERNTARVDAADTSAPLLVTRWNNKLVAVDGLHRLAKAKKGGLDKVPVKMVTLEDLKAARLLKPKKMTSARKLGLVKKAAISEKEKRAFVFTALRQKLRELLGGDKEAPATGAPAIAAPTTAAKPAPITAKLRRPSERSMSLLSKIKKKAVKPKEEADPLEFATDIIGVTTPEPTIRPQEVA